MIIECEACHSKFKVDEGLLREEGTKVRCSLCKHVFKVYPPGLGPAEEEGVFLTKEHERTSTMEMTPDFEEKEETIEEGIEDFDQAFEEVETARIEGILPRRPVGERQKERAALEEGLERISPAGRGAVREEKVAETPKKPEKRPKAAKVKKPRRSPLLSIILIVLLLLLGSAAALYYLAPEYIPSFITESVPSLQGVGAPDAKDPGFRRLSLKAITGSFVQSNKHGQLFLIRGMVENNYSNNRSLILIKGSILDDKGKVVKTKLAYAGNVFTESELKDLSLEQINQALRNRSGKGNMNMDVKPQAAIPFIVVFEELPENLSEFTVEAVSSSQVK